MYKIYINEQVMILKQTAKVTLKSKDNPKNLVMKYRGQKKFLLNYVDMLEKGSRFKKIIIHSEDYRQLKKDFLSLYTVVKAGGGLVVNEKNEILFIYRRGSWDLPKGKIEKKESIKNCALREVAEETGIKDIKLLKKITVTHHQYRIGNSRKIKESHWYLMQTKKQKLIPQTAEDIVKAKWMTIEKFYIKSRIVYLSILEVLNTYEKNLIQYTKLQKKATKQID